MSSKRSHADRKHRMAKGVPPSAADAGKEIFNNNWATYRKVVEGDHLEHKRLLGALAHYVQEKTGGQAADILDLGARSGLGCTALKCCSRPPCSVALPSSSNPTSVCWPGCGDASCIASLLKGPGAAAGGRELHWRRLVRGGPLARSGKSGGGHAAWQAPAGARQPAGLHGTVQRDIGYYLCILLAAPSGSGGQGGGGPASQVGRCMHALPYVTTHMTSWQF